MIHSERPLRIPHSAATITDELAKRFAKARKEQAERLRGWIPKTAPLADRALVFVPKKTGNALG